MLFWFQLVFNSCCYNIIIYCFRLGIYRIHDHEAIVTITTVGLEVVLIGMLDLDELELPPSTLVVYTLLFFGFRILGWITSLNPYSHEFFFCSESGSFQGKTTNRRESEKQAYGGSFSSTSGVSSHQQISHRFSLQFSLHISCMNSSM